MSTCTSCGDPILDGLELTGSEHLCEACLSAPEGWLCSTRLPKHIAFLYDEGDRRSLALYPTNVGTGWSVLGLSNYDPVRVLAENVDVATAIDTAHREMEAQIEGESLDAVRIPDALSGTGDDQDGETKRGDSNAGVDDQTEPGKDGQETLAAFVDS